MNQFELTQSILTFRKDNESFRQSIETRSEQMQWKFYDGPPFTSGDPHYGHLLQSTVKDMVPRWMTMRGYRVDRKRGWDCHGIPAENFVNKKLGITSKRQVEEEFGLQKYVEECRTMVGEVNDNRSRFVDHLGRRVDMDNAYFTMNNEYMESVIHLFADLYHNNLIYKGFKVLGYSRALGTALSNSEIAEGYMDRQDPAVTVKLELTGRNLNERMKSFEQEHNPGEFEKTEDNYVKVVRSVIRDDKGRYLMLYQNKFGHRVFPGGRVDTGETLEQAVVRETKEEIGLEPQLEGMIAARKIIVKTKNLSCGELYQSHYFEGKITGEPKNIESEKHAKLARLEIVESDNDLGWAVKVEDLIVDDPAKIQSEFSDISFLQNTTPDDLEGMTSGSVSMLARTTTPWTLPSNMFGAVNREVIYLIVFDRSSKEYYVLAKSLLGNYYKESSEYIVVFETTGETFLNLSYRPLFDYYYKSPHIDPSYHKEVHKILHADFVTEDSGTGIAHEAPAFGEDDYNLVTSLESDGVISFSPEKASERLFNPVDDHGEFTEEVPDFAGQNVIASNKEVIKKLKENGVLVKHETLNHSYPHCPRTKEPIIYRAMESWFVKEKELTQKTLPLAEQINFVPPEIKKRFTNGLASAPDWNISRTRFRGAPLPVWECEDEGCEERRVFGSIAEIAAASGQEVTDLHRPYIDEITVPCSCGKTMRRIPEVLDCWFESGSMPYGQDHYMKEKEDGAFSSTADFIAEGLDQTRGRFRSLHVLGAAYTDNIVYRNVLITGMILAEDGKKMSKSLKNYPDPRGLLEKYGSDAFRLYMLGSPVVRAEPLRFSEQGVEQVLKDFVIPLQNVRNFFKTYASVDEWKHDGTEVYFMRHADKDESKEGKAEGKQVSLSRKGFEEIKSQNFVERVLRVNPDVIITTDRLRAIQTAQGAQIAIKDHIGRDVEVIQRTNLVDGFDQDSCGRIYQELVEEFKGKRVLIVSHRWRFLHLWNELFDTEFKHKDNEGVYGLGSTEIAKLPTINIHNELDQRILSELYTMMGELDEKLAGYELEPATKTLMGFMDKLTNRWLRRSRRRFRAEGMDKDKQAVYWTLREILSIYLKLAAPFAPFVTEWVWQEMGAFVDSETSSEGRDSIHLEHRPLFSNKYVNQELSDEITQVRKVIKGAMYLRAKHQIKVKQPLQELRFKI